MTLGVELITSVKNEASRVSCRANVAKETRLSSTQTSKWEQQPKRERLVLGNTFSLCGMNATRLVCSK